MADADWTMIKRIKEHFGDRVPIIANGGIENLSDVHRCLGTFLPYSMIYTYIHMPIFL